MLLAVLSVTVGTLGAIYQTKLKRIFAFSTVTNMGYLISIMSSMNIDTVFAVIFYLLIYNFISLSLWGFLLTVRNKSTNTAFKDIRELLLLYNSDKFLCFYFCIVLFSAMGVPPLLGFFSKLYLFLNLIDLKMYIFVIYIIFLNGLTNFYYLRLIQVMFTFKTNKYIFVEDPGQLKTFLMVCLVYIHILFFLYPTHIMLILHNILLSIYL